MSELEALGATQLREQPAGVEFSGDMETAYRACLWSRCANRILLPLATFAAPTPEALYEGVQSVDWSAHFTPSETLAIDFVARNSQIQHSQFGAQKVKDAIVDQFRATCGERPSVDIQNPDMRINLFLQRDQATLYLDLSGDSLHKRGYRQAGGAAPLKENLAAAILLRAEWPRIAAEGGGLVDPMCGSGTLLIEAVMIAADWAPGLLRERYGFLAWQQHDAALWQRLTDEAAQRRDTGLEHLPPIFGYDSHGKAIQFAQASITAAGLDEHIRLAKRDVAELRKPAQLEQGLVVVNPPYGERMGERETLEPLYRQLGERLKAEFSGWEAAVFTGNPELAKLMGIRAQKQHNMFNGALPCKLLRFHIDPEWYMTEQRGPRPAKPEELGPGAEMLANRLRKNLKELGRWARREGVSCYRLYDADMPEYALAVDLYQGEQRWVHVQEYEAPKTVDERKARLRLREAMAVIPEVLALPQENVYFKVRKRQKGAAQYTRQAEEKQFFEIEEGGCRFLVNFTDYLDTGLFLDHRITRQMVADMAKGKRFLNLFAYTGTVSVYAARGGAKSTLTVDMSNTYLDWARQNMALNGFDGEQHQFVQADCLEWLKQGGVYKRAKFDLIFLDPPTFSSSKRMTDTFDVQRDHPAVIGAAMALLDAGGTLVFSNNFRKFKIDPELEARFAVEDITPRTLPRDFARNPKIHHCWLIRHQ
ncbi:50S rRNA methyltransferase [Candidatus Tenderia electrophaga]|uniref:Ribosomal RNA large subunit methyltransferase K/L n=1 Tax=Candidatus Tenderia electrophaga TaxID=1748243 RepID=A0A0S2TI72_9GAMM|nr:50S rRNA methyltransferase [Candidatus Tenderia electrophaga]